MDKRRAARLAAVMIVAVMGVIFLALFITDYQNNGKSMQISLPSETVAEDTAGSAEIRPEEGLPDYRTVSVSPENVQAVLKTMGRPDNYSLEATVENLYGGKTRKTAVKYYRLGGYSRTEKTVDGASAAEITVSGQGKAFIWQEGNTWYYRGAEGEFDPDSNAGFPTYEDVLAADPADIREAEYRDLDGESCIYVSVYDGETGIVDRYWISLSNGLLIRAESGSGEDTDYRMTAAKISLETPPDSILLLPTDVSATEVT